MWQPWRRSARLGAVLTATMVAAPVLADSAPAVTAPTTTEPAETAATVTVATFNVCNSKCGKGKFAWNRRARSVIRNIVSSRADIVAVQEADRATSAWLVRRMAARGYEWAQPDVTTCDRGCVPDSHVFYRRGTIELSGVRLPSDPVPERCSAFVADSDPAPPVAVPEHLDHPPEPPAPGPRASEQELLEYRAAMKRWRSAKAEVNRVNQQRRTDYQQEVDHWYEQTSALNCVRYHGWTPTRSADAGSQAHSVLVRARGAQDRNVSWALLRHTASGALIMAASVHLPNEKTARAERVRKRLARAIPAYLKSTRELLGAAQAPTLVMGDLNSFWQRQPRGAQWILGRQGYTDAYTAPRRVNPEVPTINVTSRLRNQFPARPFRFDKPARLDYVFFDRGAAKRYEVYLRLRRGKFDDRYRSSDHNLVRARLALPVTTG